MSPRLIHRLWYLIVLVARPISGDHGVECLCLSRQTDLACNIAPVMSLSNASYLDSCNMVQTPDLLDSVCSLIRQKNLWWMNCWCRILLYYVATLGSSNCSLLNRCAGNDSVLDPKNPTMFISIKKVSWSVRNITLKSSNPIASMNRMIPGVDSTKLICLDPLKWVLGIPASDSA
jgi:hypothetical protein